jgi:hypothetical protein
MIINDRLQRLLKKVCLEEQNGFSNGRGAADRSFRISQALNKQREQRLESWMLLVDLVVAFDSVPRGVLWAMLAKIGVPPHLIYVTKRMNVDLEATFDLNGEPVEVPCTVGVKKGFPLSPTLFVYVVRACVESL